MQQGSQWIQVGELAPGFASQRFSTYQFPEGACYLLNFESGKSGRLLFLPNDQLTWQTESTQQTVTYTANPIRPHIYFIDCLLGEPQSEGEKTSLSLILDTQKSLLTAVHGQLPNPEEMSVPLYQRASMQQQLTSVRTDFSRAAVDQPWANTLKPHHALTTAMLGLRMQYEYSDSECYEHVYLNPNFYAWHCRRGNEQGLADSDLCSYRQLDTGLYLFVWQEKIVPTLGVVLIDLADLPFGQSCGKIFGYAGNQTHASENIDASNRYSNFRVASKATMLSKTIYPN